MDRVNCKAGVLRCVPAFLQAAAHPLSQFSTWEAKFCIHAFNETSCTCKNCLMRSCNLEINIGKLNMLSKFLFSVCDFDNRATCLNQFLKDSCFNS